MSQAPIPESGFTEDRLLDGRVLLRQPADGFRAAIDPVMLASAVAAEPGQSVLDIGTGSGAAALCLAWRLGQVRVTGLEIQRDLVRLASENAALNGFEGRVQAMLGDVRAPPLRLAPGSFDHVMTNPPYLEAGTATLPADAARATAVGEGAELRVWLRFALAMLRDRGSLTIVHRADRLDAILAALLGQAGDIVVFPLWPGTGKAAKRMLVRARKGVATPLRLAAGLVLHEGDGRFTVEADAVLRGRAHIDLSGAGPAGLDQAVRLLPSA
ncbi:MAG TPA: methyltransferase [Stellaceae bacterium]|jgi:tRNA1(Val) A37 N6-methylase TrmN6|nr:methyltransferase [Stellaceae bacterium]